MSTHRQAVPNTGCYPRTAVIIPLRPKMLEALREMHSKTIGVSAGLPFETFLAEILETAAAEHRSKAWRSEHPHELEASA
jgi:hypothetical protein